MILPLLEVLLEKKRAVPVLGAREDSPGDLTAGNFIVLEAGEPLLGAERGKVVPSGGVMTTIRYSGDGGRTFSFDVEEDATSSPALSLLGVSGRASGVPIFGVEEPLFRELVLPVLWCRPKPSIP